MRDNLGEYKSKVISGFDRIVAQHEDEYLIEKRGNYLIKGFKKIGQATVTFYRGIDEQNDPIKFVEAYQEGR